MAYEYLWFDLGMTLVETSRSIRYQKVLEDFQIVKEEKEIRKAYHITDKIFMREYPHVLGQSPEKFFPWYLGVLNYEHLVRKFMRHLWKRKQMRVSSGSASRV